MPTLKEKYDQEIVPRLKEEGGGMARMAVPRISKVVVNMGVGIADKDALKNSADDLAKITGQRPMITKARKSISNFRLREGMSIGAKVTLRGGRMYDFLERLIHAALPRIRDFRGISPRGFDGQGNFTLGLKEQTIFPEIDPNNVSTTQGMDVTIVTTAADDETARKLLTMLGMPFAST